MSRTGLWFDFALGRAEREGDDAADRLRAEATIEERLADAAKREGDDYAAAGDLRGAMAAWQAAASYYEGAALYLGYAVSHGGTDRDTYRAMTLRRRARWVEADASAYADRLAGGGA